MATVSLTTLELPGGGRPNSRGQRSGFEIDFDRIRKASPDKQFSSRWMLTLPSRRQPPKP